MMPLWKWVKAGNGKREIIKISCSQRTPGMTEYSALLLKELVSTEQSIDGFCEISRLFSVSGALKRKILEDLESRDVFLTFRQLVITPQCLLVDGISASLRLGATDQSCTRPTEHPLVCWIL